MNPLFRIDFSISDSLKIVRKSVLIYETIIQRNKEVNEMGKRTEIVMDEYIDVLEKIKERITQAQYQVMTNANVERNILFWNIGNVILQYSKWGNKFVETLSKDLRMTYPSREGYSVRNLNYML